MRYLMTQGGKQISAREKELENEIHPDKPDFMQQQVQRASTWVVTDIWKYYWKHELMDIILSVLLKNVLMLRSWFQLELMPEGWGQIQPCASWSHI